MTMPDENPTRMADPITLCAVIPLYNHHKRIIDIVAQLQEHELPIIIVDDGSDESTHQVLRNLENSYAENTEKLHIHCLPYNQGKGAAVLEGLKLAKKQGFSHALQIDADGQHDIKCLPKMLAHAQQYPAALISGKPVYNASVPKSRLYGRKINHFWAAIETLSLQLKDTMCGFRIYPVDKTLKVNANTPVGRRMEFDTEILVRLYWEGCPVHFLPVAVNYPADGSSHFKAFSDNWRISRMHTRLVLAMLPKLPRLIARRFKSNPATPTWANMRERGSSLGMRIVITLYRLLGRRVCLFLLGPISLYFFITHEIARHASLKYLRHIHPYTEGVAARDTKPGLINSLKHFYSFSLSLLDKAAIWQGKKASITTIKRNREILQNTLEKNRGLLLISAHIGNLEFCRALATAHSKLRINALVYTRNAEKFTRLMESLDKNYRFRLLLVDKIGMDTGIMLRNLIDQGEIVVIVGDRTPINEHGSITHASFLGQSAPFATGPYVLAHILECPVQLLFCVREGGKHVIHIEHFEDRIHLPRKTRQQEISRLAQDYADRLAYYASRYPLQWFNFFDFWATPKKDQA